MDEVTIRIVGSNLPGLNFGEHRAVHVGVQRDADVVERVPGDAEAAIFEFPVRIVRTDAGPDFRGPYVHGPRGARFTYLSWGDVASDGAFAMFRRAKLHLSAIGDELIEGALATGAPIEATLRLTDGRGGPLCASVRPPLITWAVGAGQAP